MQHHRHHSTTAVAATTQATTTGGYPPPTTTHPSFRSPSSSSSSLPAGKAEKRFFYLFLHARQTPLSCHPLPCSVPLVIHGLRYFSFRGSDATQRDLYLLSLLLLPLLLPLLLLRFDVFMFSFAFSHSPLPLSLALLLAANCCCSPGVANLNASVITRLADWQRFSGRHCSCDTVKLVLITQNTR